MDDLRRLKEERESIFLDQMRELGEMAEGVDDYDEYDKLISENNEFIQQALYQRSLSEWADFSYE